MKIKKNCFLVLLFLISLTASLCALAAGGEDVSSLSGAPADEITIDFFYNGNKWKFTDRIEFDKNDADLIHELTRRGYFLDARQKKEKIDEIVSLGFTKKQAADLVLAGLNDMAGTICKKINKPAIDSVIEFNPDNEQIFGISEDKAGLKVDEEKLYTEIINRLDAASSFSVKVPVITLHPKATKKQNILNTSLKAAFSTSYETSTPNRKSNIELALSKFNGMRIKPGGEVSFNKTAGKRTEKNGYKESKIIINGKYEDGIGGGVCQSSTTLYNTAILAGLEIKEWHRHSLPCVYVPASFDAMVSERADLVFVNNTENEIFLKTAADGSQAKVWIYGSPNKYKIVRESEIVKIIEAEVKIINDSNGDYLGKVYYDDEQCYITSPVNGIVSKGYLKYYDSSGRLVEKKQIRNDIYNTQNGLIVRGVNKRPAEYVPPNTATIFKNLCRRLKFQNIQYI